MPSTPTTATQIRILAATGSTARPFARLSPYTVFFGLNTTLGSSLTVAPRFCVTVAAKSSPAGEQKWTHEGSVTESLPNGMFRVRLENQDLIIGYISGKIRKNHVRILPGDRVKVEVSRYDSSRGRIVYRLSNKESSSD